MLKEPAGKVLQREEALIRVKDIFLKNERDGIGLLFLVGLSDFNIILENDPIIQNVTKR